MFLHLGGDYSVRAGEVISIHDYEAMNKTETGKAFLQKRKKYIRDVSDGRSKSVVVTDGNIYLSALSPGTLKKRAGAFAEGFLYKN
ncbi:MAG: DUF370 domain-containing protein [Schwartzia sp.]|nr:DUF370 domain-containing protein [Schwartzia sp. (in: firmicutes)]